MLFRPWPTEWIIGIIRARRRDKDEGFCRGVCVLSEFDCSICAIEVAEAAESHGDFFFLPLRFYLSRSDFLFCVTTENDGGFPGDNRSFSNYIVPIQNVMSSPRCYIASQMLRWVFI